MMNSNENLDYINYKESIEKYNSKDFILKWTSFLKIQFPEAKNLDDFISNEDH